MQLEVVLEKKPKTINTENFQALEVRGLTGSSIYWL